MSDAVRMREVVARAVAESLLASGAGGAGGEFVARPDVREAIDAFVAAMLRLRDARRLPVYLLLDTSGSMRGEPLVAMSTGLRSFVAAVRQDPQACDTVCLSLITFDRDVKVLSPLTPALEMQLPVIDAPESGPTHLGRALQVLCERVDEEVRLAGTMPDWQPLLFILTDGRPSDMQVFREAIPEVRRRAFGAIFACTVGPHARADDLRALASEVLSHDVMDAGAFSQCLRWIDSALHAGPGQPVPAPLEPLPPPPPPGRSIVL